MLKCLNAKILGESIVLDLYMNNDDIKLSAINITINIKPKPFKEMKIKAKDSSKDLFKHSII